MIVAIRYQHRNRETKNRHNSRNLNIVPYVNQKLTACR